MSNARWAQRYTEHGVALTRTAPGQKGPRHAGWNKAENAITTPAAAFNFWTENPECGIAALLGLSGLCSLDVDDMELSRQVLRHVDVDLDALAASFPCIVGRPGRCRIMFKAPEQELKHHNMVWPKREDSRKGFVLFELRAGALADTLPPTIHPETKEPYRWAVPPRNGFPPLPDQLLAIWRDWSSTERKMRALCPWAPPPPTMEPKRTTPRATDKPSVIAAFNAAHDPAAILEAHGYQRKGQRFVAPDSRHAAGLVLLESGRVFSHHAGDVLGGGHARDAFDIWTILEHGGNTRMAVRNAAQILGMANGS